jgi:hypothetical protein
MCRILGAGHAGIGAQMSRFPNRGTAIPRSSAKPQKTLWPMTPKCRIRQKQPYYCCLQEFSRFRAARAAIYSTVIFAHFLKNFPESQKWSANCLLQMRVILRGDLNGK